MAAPTPTPTPAAAAVASAAAAGAGALGAVGEGTAGLVVAAQAGGEAAATTVTVLAETVPEVGFGAELAGAGGRQGDHEVVGALVLPRQDVEGGADDGFLVRLVRALLLDHHRRCLLLGLARRCP